MKKLTLLAIAALAISFASCKKDYTCTCTSTFTGCTSCGGTSTTIIKGVSKKAATANCVSMESKDDAGVTQYSSSCALSK